MTTLTHAPAIKTCNRCLRRNQEIYVYWDESFVFDVERARNLVQDGREPVEVEEECVQASVDNSTIEEEHIYHVDPSIPGVIAHVFYRTPEGEEIQAHLLVDGNHRAARCLHDRQPFYAYVLTELESRSIVIQSPDKPRPVQESKEELDEATTQAYTQKFQSSYSYSQRARKVFAGATTHDRRGFGPFGIYIDRAEGVRKWDVQGQEFIDYWMGHGSLLMGHGYGPVVEAITRQASRGTHYGACHPLEVQWAELVRSLIPSAERVRFTASGTEATLLAIRVARAYTGRKKIIRFDSHFHGWHDEAMSHFYREDSAGLNPGAHAHVVLIQQNNLEAVQEQLSNGDVAAVILEPGGGGAGGMQWSPEFLRSLREATRQHDTLLIFDEVISGFRFTPGGVQSVSGVLPDMTTLAKILCGGLPGGALAGRTDVMAVFGDGTQVDHRFAQIPHTGTFNANPLSAAAGIALLEHVADGVPQERAKRATERLVARFNERAEAYRLDAHMYTNGTSIYHILIGAHRTGASLQPSQAVAHLFRDYPRKYALLRRALLIEGIDTHPIHGWVSALHDDDAILDATALAFDRAFARLKHVDELRR